MVAKKNEGSSLSQYAIIIALIALALVPILMLFGNNIKSILDSYSSMFEANNKIIEEHIADNSNNQLKGGQLGGTPSNPVKECKDSSCTIDFGDFILTGLPENFGELTETSGTSGGEDLLADLLTQIAEQRKESDPEGSKEYLRLANLIHMQGDIVRQIEEKVTSGCTRKELQDFYFNTKLQATGYTIPTDLTDALPSVYLDQKLSMIMNAQSEIGYARDRKINSPAYFDSNKDQFPGFAIVDQYDTIMANSKYPDSLKNITQEIFQNFADLSFNAQGFLGATAFCSTAGGCSNAPQSQIDPITGVAKPPVTFSSGELDEVLHPKYSLKDDLSGALLCTAGKDKDTAKSCH